MAQPDMRDFSISWTDAGGEHLQGGYADGWMAVEAARERASGMGRNVDVVRPDGTVFMTVKPASSATISKVTPPERIER